MENFTIIIPARNEEVTVGRIVGELRELYPSAEVLVVNDGSDDNTFKCAREAGATVINHPISLGNGAAIKAGAQKAKYKTIVFMDGDGQHSPKDLGLLLRNYDEGYDLVVGAREGRAHHSSIPRWIANSIYNSLASVITGVRIRDLTSGYRVVSKEKLLSILHLLPNKFSYPTTSTIAFIRSGFSVGFVGVPVKPSLGGSHISPLKDGIRFLVIIFKVIMLYSPFKVFAPLAILQLLAGLLLYAPGLINGAPVFTNGMALLFSGGVLTLSVAILSEQITILLYK